MGEGQAARRKVELSVGESEHSFVARPWFQDVTVANPCVFEVKTHAVQNHLAWQWFQDVMVTNPCVLEVKVDVELYVFLTGPSFSSQLSVLRLGLVELGRVGST